MIELDLDGFFLVFFSWKFTSEGNRLGSCLNLAASCGQKFMQHVTSYRGVWLSGSRDVQTNQGMLVAILIYFDIHRHSAMSTEHFCHRKMSSKGLSVPWPQYPAFFAVFVYVYDKNSKRTTKNILCDVYLSLILVALDLRRIAVCHILSRLFLGEFCTCCLMSFMSSCSLCNILFIISCDGLYISLNAKGMAHTLPELLGNRI